MAAPTAPDTATLSPEELAAWRGLLQAHAQLTRALDTEMRAEHGMGVSAYEVLMFLADADGHRLRMAQIAERVLLSRSGLTRLVDRLVQLGLVTRCAAEGDGRGAYAELTSAGLEKLQAARRTHLGGVRAHFLDRLTVADTLVLGDVWRRVVPAAAEGAC